MMFPYELKCYRRLVFDEEEEYVEYIDNQTLVLDQNPINVVALNNRGVAYFELGKLAEAAADLQRACEIGKEKISHLNFAEVTAALGDLDGAIALASQAIEISPSDSSAYAVRAGFYEKKGDMAKSLKDREHSNSLRKASP